MRNILIVALAAVLLGGCGDSDKNASKGANAAPQTPKMYRDMVPEDVVVVVNGEKVTKGDLEREIAVQCELFKLTKPNAKISDVEKHAERMRRHALKGAIDRRMMVAEAKKRGVTATAEERQQMRDAIAKKILKGAKPSFALLLSKLPAELRKEFESGVDLDTLCQKMNVVLRKETKVAVTLAEAEKSRKELLAYNERAAKREQEIWQNASNAWQRIEKGEDFAKVAEDCAKQDEHVKHDLEWGEFDMEFFKDDPDVCHHLNIMKEGAVTPPVVGLGGLMLVKLIKRIPANFGAGQVHPRYELANIFFELPQTFEIGKVEDVQKQLASELSEKAFRKRVKDLVDATKVEYPNGEMEVTMRKVRPHKHGPNCKHKK